MQVKFNLCRFLRRAVERETRRDVGLAILKYAGLLELPDRAKLEAYLVLQTILDPAYLMSYPGIAGLDCKRIRSFHRV